MSSSTTSSSTGTPPPCLSDAACDDGVECSIDKCEPGGCTHSADSSQCDDGVFCTSDACDVSKGCVHTSTDAICDDGIDCTNDSCDQKSDTCEHDPCDGKCDDQLFCTGVERCDTSFGCTSGAASCVLDLDCSEDTCNEASDACLHAQTPGCASPTRLLITDATGVLKSVAPYTGEVELIAPSSGKKHLDVAILDGRWFVIDGSGVFELFPNTNQIENVLPPVDGNSLGAGPDGFLYAASTIVTRIDPDSGVSTVVGSLPPGESSSGDIAFLNGSMYISTDGPCGGALVEFDLSSGTGKVLGGDGLGCVYGLATVASTLFVINCDGTIGTFDPTTGEARILSTTSVTVYGAEGLP